MSKSTIFLSASFILSLIFAPSIAGAQYYGNPSYQSYYPYGTYNYNYNYNNSAQISSIQAQLNALYQQLNSINQSQTYPYTYNNYSYNNYPYYMGYNGSVLGAATYNPSYSQFGSCNFTYDMGIGSSGGQVTDLNRILGVGGSYYGTATRDAVIAFQNQYASEILTPAGYSYGTGHVGPLTRAKLNALCNGITTPTNNYGGSVLGANTYYNPGTTVYWGNQTCQLYGGASCYNSGYNYNYSNATLNFYASATNLNNNDTVTLSWSGSNINSCNAQDGWSGSKNISGSETRTVYGNTTFTLNCYGTNGQQINRSVTVYTSGNSSGNNTISMNFYANPSSVYSGGSTALYWTVYNANTCNASGDWSGSRGTSGQQSVSATTNNRSYTLTCTNNSGQSYAQTISVGVL